MWWQRIYYEIIAKFSKQPGGKQIWKFLYTQAMEKYLILSIVKYKWWSKCRGSLNARHTAIQMSQTITVETVNINDCQGLGVTEN